MDAHLRFEINLWMFYVLVNFLFQLKTCYIPIGLAASRPPNIFLTVIVGNPPQQIEYKQHEEASEATRLISTFNNEQAHAFYEIMNAVNDKNTRNRLFYIDGPGGSGKSFLFKAIMSYMRGQGKIMLVYTTTGIAGTLFKGGRTVHSGCKFPVPVTETSVSSMRPSSPEAEEIRKAAITVIDKVTIMENNTLNCIDRLFREITKDDNPFGGKVLVIAEDFRQTLPVVMRATKTEIMEKCIKTNPLWRHFKVLTFATNMRSNGQNAHNKWLLNVGEGKLPAVAGILEEDIIEIPTRMVEKNDLIYSFFGDINQMSSDDFSQRIIVAPTNLRTLEMNNQIIDMIPGEEKNYKKCRFHHIRRS